MRAPIIYSHINKGYTVGYSLTRRLCRTVMGAIAIPIDLIIACFWAPNYKQYWKDFRYTYPDGTPVSGIQGIFGYVGDIVGTIIGACLGVAISTALYIPDLILSLLSTMVYDKICDLANTFITMIQRNQDQYKLYINDPKNFFSKSWNISAVTLGTVIALTPWLVFRTIEAFIPGNTHIFSEFFWNTGQFIGGFIGSIVSLPVCLAKQLFDGCQKVYNECRSGIRATTALTYALTDAAFCKENDEETCVPPLSIHSTEFRELVNYYKKEGAWVNFFSRGEDNHNHNNERLNPNLEGIEQRMN